MSHRIISSLLTGYTGYMKHVSSHVRNINVTRYQNVIIFDIPLYTEASELAEMIEVIKEKHNLKITYSVKKEPEPECERHD